jgi:hypothetical protein
MSLRAAQVRIYVDADMLGLGKILASLRNDVTYPGATQEPSSTGGKGRLAPSRALTCSIRTGYLRWPAGDG